MALLNCNFCSAVLGKNTALTVLLPEHRHKPRKIENKKYPVLYALHGLGQDHTNWQRDGFLEHLLKDQDIIVVMPDCGRSFYTDGVHGYRYFTYLTEELPLIVCNNFPASREGKDTYIAGISMGGYGALKAALWRPDLYTAVGALSAGIDPWQGISLAPPEMFSCTDHEDNIRNIFGSPENFYASQNNLFRAFDRTKMSGKPIPEIFIGCGKEDFFYDMNCRFKKYVESAGVSVEFVSTEGVHSWDCWNTLMPKLLEWFGFSQKNAFGTSALG